MLMAKIWQILNESKAIRMAIKILWVVTKISAVILTITVILCYLVFTTLMHGVNDDGE